MAAMQECIDEYGGLIWSLARRFCPSPAQAEDAVQEVFIALWENASRFDESKGAEVTFVAMIARRRLIDSGRSESVDFEQRTAEVDEAQRAMQAMEQLSEDQQRVLKLAVYRGLTHDEIAQATGLPLGTVKTHARRGLIRVRELLAGTGSEETVRSRS
jgi:RNA polymerase sigma-70 factor (ECF subfamily)